MVERQRAVAARAAAGRRPARCGARARAPPRRARRRRGRRRRRAAPRRSGRRRSRGRARARRAAPRRAAAPAGAPTPTARDPAARPPRRTRSGRAPARGYASAGMRLRLIRHATLLVKPAGRCVLVDPMLDPAGARPPVADTPNPRRNPLVELPEPAEVVVQGLDAVARHPPAPGPPRRRPRSALLPEGRAAVLRSPRTPRRCAGTASPTCGRSTTRVDWDGVRIARTGGATARRRSAERWRRCRASCSWRRRAGALRRRRHDLVRRGARRARRAPARRRRRQRRRRALPRGRPDRDDRRRRRRRRPPRARTRASSPSTSRRSTTACRRAPTCTSASTRSTLHDRVTVPEDGAEVPLP